MRFQLTQGNLYAMEMISDEFGHLGKDPRHCSPIKVITNVEPGSDPSGSFEFHFIHLFYPAGVQDKTYPLRPMEWGTHYFLAESLEHDPKRILLILPLTVRWMEQRCKVTLDPGETMAQWMETHLGFRSGEDS